MTVLYCPRCEGEVQIPDLPAAQRDEIARLRYGSSTVEAYEKLSELSGLDLRLAKRLVIHLPHRPGECHRCGAALPQGVAVQCAACGSVNVQWRIGDEEAA